MAEGVEKVRKKLAAEHAEEATSSRFGD